MITSYFAKKIIYNHITTTSREFISQEEKCFLLYKTFNKIQQKIELNVFGLKTF